METGLIGSPGIITAQSFTLEQPEDSVHVQTQPQASVVHPVLATKTLTMTTFLVLVSERTIAGCNSINAQDISLTLNLIGLVQVTRCNFM